MEEPPDDEEDPIGAQAVRGPGQGPLDCHHALLGGCGAEERPGLLRQPAPVLVGVESDHPHPGGHQQLHDQLTHQTEADHARGVPDLRARLANPLQCDGADGGERRQLGRDPVGYRHAEIGRHPVDLGVECVLIPGARHELADRELLGPRADLEDDTGERVAQG